MVGAKNATRRDRGREAAGGILTFTVVRVCLGAEESQPQASRATSFEPLETAVSETQMVESGAHASWICDLF